VKVLWWIAIAEALVGSVWVASKRSIYSNGKSTTNVETRLTRTDHRSATYRRLNSRSHPWDSGTGPTAVSRVKQRRRSRTWLISDYYLSLKEIFLNTRGYILSKSTSSKYLSSETSEDKSEYHNIRN
jgi:hypothetical protein